jgi:hypothetical protein
MGLLESGCSPRTESLSRSSRYAAGLSGYWRDQEIEVSPRSPGYRSSFVGAVLLTVPGAIAIRTSPPRIRHTDPLTAYRASEAGPVNHWWATDPGSGSGWRSPTGPASAWTCTARSEIAAVVDKPATTRS